MNKASWRLAQLAVHFHAILSAQLSDLLRSATLIFQRQVILSLAIKC